jgi:hypothetical protein
VTQATKANLQVTLTPAALAKIVGAAQRAQQSLSDWMAKTLYIQATRPRIVCLCGSTRFSEAFRAANLRETLAGNIVLSIGCEWHSDQGLGLDEGVKARLDELHLRKIDLCDEVLILNVGSYIGPSTSRELEYARSRGKTIRFLEAQAEWTP